MTHAQDRMRAKVTKLKYQIKTLEKQKPQVQAEIDKTPKKSLRYAQGKLLLERINKAIESSQKDIKLLELQI